MKKLNTFLFYVIVGIVAMHILCLIIDVVYAESYEVAYTSINQLKKPDVIPEPSSLILLLSGISGFFMLRKVK